MTQRSTADDDSESDQPSSAVVRGALIGTADHAVRSAPAAAQANMQLVRPLCAGPAAARTCKLRVAHCRSGRMVTSATSRSSRSCRGRTPTSRARAAHRSRLRHHRSQGSRQGQASCYHWRIENPELHQGAAALGAMYFKIKGRYYYRPMRSSSSRAGPNGDLGAVVFDVTGLPDTTKIKEVAPHPGAGHARRLPRTSSRTSIRTAGRCCSPRSQDAVRARLRHGQVGRRGARARAGRHRSRVPTAYHRVARCQPAITTSTWATIPRPSRTSSTAPARAATTSSMSPTCRTRSCSRRSPAWPASTIGHTFTPDPDGRYAVAEAEYQYAAAADLRPEARPRRQR